jgi:hypothetical protein
VQVRWTALRSYLRDSPFLNIGSGDLNAGRGFPKDLNQLACCSYINQRVFRISPRMLKASAFNERCLSSFGKSP